MDSKCSKRQKNGETVDFSFLSKTNKEFFGECLCPILKKAQILKGENAMMNLELIGMKLEEEEFQKKVLDKEQEIQNLEKMAKSLNDKQLIAKTKEIIMNVKKVEKKSVPKTDFMKLISKIEKYEKETTNEKKKKKKEEMEKLEEFL